MLFLCLLITDIQSKTTPKNAQTFYGNWYNISFSECFLTANLIGAYFLDI